MPAADLSGDRVAERLGALEEGYASFPVNQTTLSVSPDAYERARERCESGLADVYVQISNDVGDVLLVDGEEGWVVPHAQPGVGESIEMGTRRALAEHTGVACRLTDLERATILGVADESRPERDPVYRLVVVFAAERTGGTPGQGATWHSTLPERALPTH